MSPSPQHDPVEAGRQPAPGAARAPAVLVPFPGPGARRPRRAPGGDERRGEILFFLGVRYERLAS